MHNRVVCGQEEPVQGWANAPWRAIPTAVYAKTAPGIVRFVYVLYPTRPGQAGQIESLKPLGQAAGSEVRALEIVFTDGRVDIILFAGQSEQETKFGAFSTDGEAAVARIGNDRIPRKAFVVSGTFVKLDGQPLDFQR